MRRTLLMVVALLLLVVAAASAGNRRFTLVIDPGHGGHDSGAKGKSAYEKNINLKVALAFGRYVERNCPDVKVIYTRKSDVFISLSERAAIANRNKADLFISVHTNALPGGKIARGFEVYTLGMHRANDNLDVAKRENSVILVEKDYKTRYQGFDPKSSESYIMFEFMQDKYMAKSVDLAKMIQRNVCQTASRPNKGVHQAGFLVLRETSMPSCLIELGFITTPEEERLLTSEKGIDEHARGIYNAFVKYKNKYAGGKSGPFVNPVVQEPASPTAEKTKDNLPQLTKIPETNGQTQAQERTASGAKASLPPSQGLASPSLQMSSQNPSQASPRREQISPSLEIQNQKSTDNVSMGTVDDASQQVVGQVPLKTEVAEQGSQDSVVDTGRNAKVPSNPVFKVQILVNDTPLPSGSRLFKGLSGVDVYRENQKWKYTYGADTNYNVIYRLRKSILDKFPNAFIIAFRDGEKMDVVEALREFKAKRGR